MAIKQCQGKEMTMPRPALSLVVGSVLSFSVAENISARANEAPRTADTRVLPALLGPGSLEADAFKPVVGTPAGRLRFWPLIVREAQANQLPSFVADAVVRVESGYDPSAIGGVGEVGLMQVRPSTAAMLGFRGSPAELSDPETNIRFGVAYLAKAWRLANGDLCRALMKYRAGHGEERMSPLSVQYCERAKKHLASLGEAIPGGSASQELVERLNANRKVSSVERKPPAVRTALSIWIERRAAARDAYSQLSMRSRVSSLWAEHARSVPFVKSKGTL